MFPITLGSQKIKSLISNVDGFLYFFNLFINKKLNIFGATIL